MSLEDTSGAEGVGALAGVGVSAATGNFLGAGLGLLGLGISLFSGADQASNAQKAADIQKNITGYESQINDQRYLATTMMARRQSLEQVRTAQRTSAQATAAATNQGAQFGSGLQGGLGQITDQSGFNLSGIEQNQEIQGSIYGLNKQISAQKMALSDVQSKNATDQGLMSLGSSLMGAGKPISQLLQGFK